MIIRIITLILLIGLTVESYAQIPIPFQCDNRFYQVFNTDGSTLAHNAFTGQTEVASFNAGRFINSVGYRSADNFAYGIIVGTPNLFRLGSNGAVEDLGPIANLEMINYPAGDFADDGLLYVYQQAFEAFPNIMYGIDVDIPAVVNVVMIDGPLFSTTDMTFNPVDGLFYAVSGGDAVPNDDEIPADNLIAIDIIERTVAIVGPTNVSREESNVNFASMFADSFGNVYGQDRFSGGLYKFDKATGNGKLIGSTPVVEGVLGGTDGFCCKESVLPKFAHPRNVPTLSEWGLIATALMLGVIGFIVMRRRAIQSA
ncbi:MAG: IPTL-CTERM sorting domain-containing protein [Thermodesulfobacteriota bacterium]